MSRWSCLPWACTAVWLASSAAAAPVVTCNKTTVEAQGVSAGGKLVWAAVSRHYETGITVVEHLSEEGEDDDGDGSVALDLDRDIAPLSVWVAVDRTTGEWGVGAPVGFVPPTAQSPVLARGPRGRIDRLASPGRSVELLWVRPGGGAWRVVAGDGAGRDEDGIADGRLSLGLDRAEPIGDAAAPPEELATGDVLVWIDPETLAVAVRRLTGRWVDAVAEGR